MEYGSRTYLLQAGSLLLFCGVGFFFFRLTVFWYMAGVLAILLLIPATGLPILRAWIFVEQLVQRFINTLLLTSIFFAVLTPLALLRRILQAPNRAEPDSWYESDRQRYQKSDIEKPW